MRPVQYIIFFSIVFTLYGLLNYYIYTRGLAAIPVTGSSRTIYGTTFLVLSLSFFIGRFLERVWLSPVSFGFTWIGSFWLAAMVYFLLFALVFDFFRLLNYLFHIYPGFITSRIADIRFYTFLSVAAIVTLLLIGGHVNALSPRIESLSITIPKKVSLPSPFRIVMASDIHLGTIIGPRRVQHLVTIINSLKPDLVLFAGDVLDEDLGPVIHQNAGGELKEIRSPHGVYSITGNHEYIGGVDSAVSFLQRHNIVVLRDSVVKVLDRITIAGREDHDLTRFGGKRKKPLKELLTGVDMSKPVIVMDHQPTNLSESVEQGVDLHLSGHTHKGQIWPFSLIIKKIYDVGYGFRKRGNTHIYVSSGFGTWGPPVRIGSRPEIVEILLYFTTE